MEDRTVIAWPKFDQIMTQICYNGFLMILIMGDNGINIHKYLFSFDAEWMWRMNLQPGIDFIP